MMHIYYIKNYKNPNIYLRNELAHILYNQKFSGLSIMLIKIKITLIYKIRIRS